MRSLTQDEEHVDDTRESTRRLYLAHSADLHRYASRRVGRVAADDVVAETFRRVMEHARRFDDSLGSERAWLFGIATNILRNHRRTEMRRMAAFAREAQRTPAGTDPLLAKAGQLDARRDLRIVLDAAAALDQADYELLILVVWEELSSAEAAAALGLQPGTVRSRLHRIRRELAASHAAATKRTHSSAEGNH